MVPGTVLGGRRVDLGDIEFGLVDADGVAWGIGAEGLQGWDSAEVRSSVTQREAAHGAWMGPTYLGERVLTLTGTITAPSTTLLDAAVEELLAAVPLDGYTTLTVHETTPKQAAVRQSGKPMVKYETAVSASWSLLMTAPDPRRYGTTLHAPSAVLPTTIGGLVLPATPPWTLPVTSVGGGSISATNEGTIASLPVFTVAGPVQQPSVTVLYPDGSTQTLTYSQNIASGDVLTLDCAAHTAMVGGTSRRGYVSGQWPQIPANSTVTIFFTSTAYSSTATLTAAWRPAWK